MTATFRLSISNRYKKVSKKRNTNTPTLSSALKATSLHSFFDYETWWLVVTTSMTIKEVGVTIGACEAKQNKLNNFTSLSLSRIAYIHTMHMDWLVCKLKVKERENE